MGRAVYAEAGRAVKNIGKTVGLINRAIRMDGTEAQTMARKIRDNEGYNNEAKLGELYVQMLRDGGAMSAVLEGSEVAQQPAKVDNFPDGEYNELADTEQWNKYRTLLGNNAPDTLSAFQNIKYSGEWDAFQAYSRAIEIGELTALADFKHYQNMSAEIDNALVGTVTQNGLTVTGKSWHYIARTIGSIEQRRNGVEVQDALHTIVMPLKICPIETNMNGRSQRFIGENSAVSINPDTGLLIQVNPLRKRN